MPRGARRGGAVLGFLLLVIRLAAADPVPPFIGTRPVPYEKPFTAKAGTVDAEIPFTENWYADYYLSRWASKKAFEFFNTSYADHYAKTQAAALKAGTAQAKAKRYGTALFPLRQVASFKPDSPEAKAAAPLLETIEKAYADALAEAEKLAGEKKADAAKAALSKAAREFQGSWYAFELAERARKTGK